MQIITGSKNKSIPPGVKYDYDYPTLSDGTQLDLSPGSRLHDKILSFVLDRARDSYSIMSARHSSWNLIDRTLTAYIPLDEQERILKSQDIRTPVSIVIPYSYATLETLLTYLVTAFLDIPIFRYEGVTDDDKIGAIMLEKVVELQTVNFKAALALHTQFRDSLAYGFGVTAPIWTEYWGFQTKIEDGVRTRISKMLFEGTRLENIDVYHYLPDPSVPIHEVQRGEFVGWVAQTTLMDLMEQESTSDDLFNVRYLQHIDGRSSIFGADYSDRGKKTEISGRQSLGSSLNPVDVIWMYAKIIPSDPEWQLGDSVYPEKWMFAVAADSIVICARPIALDHNLFPVSICALDYDGYSIAPVSRMELIYGMQNVLDFLFRSHIDNVRRAVNDMFVFDPYLIDIRAFESNQGGRLIPLRRAAWGKGVKDAIMQLSVSDVTRSHISIDAPHVIELIQRTSAAVDSLMGIMRTSGERRSATEARDARMSALSRLAKTARIASIMTLQDLAYMYASHTQQLMTKEVYVRTMGRYEQDLVATFGDVRGLKVKPEDLHINYDVMIHDGTVEVGERAESWIQLFQILSARPDIAVNFDMTRIFKHIARLLGAKNVNEFMAKTPVKPILAPTEEVLNNAEKGNLVPVEGLTGVPMEE